MDDNEIKMDRGTGNAKYNLGSDEGDIAISIKSTGDAVDKTLPIPSEPTCDKELDQDGGTGKPFVETLQSRRGRTDGGSGHDSAGGFGGPNAQ